jgi:pyruvate formate-lyase activating enzyme-like uncharacterized protein
MDFNHKASDVTEEIRGLQANIPGLRFHDSYQAISTGPLIPSCEICTRMAHMVVQLGFRCNAQCPFCFLDVYDSDSPHENERDGWQTSLNNFHSRKSTLEGISLSGGEPLLYLSELEACVQAMREAKPDLYFWVYTNGILADDEHLNVLANLGVSEIRFNLAATNYSEHVLQNLERAREGFEYVVVEVPSYPKQKEKLTGCLEELNRIGINQLNLQELLVTNANVHRLEGEGYETGLLFFKKFFLYGSRKMTYEVMQHCLENDYSFTVNDCSASKFGRRPA